jgi:hypothetical protein
VAVESKSGTADASAQDVLVRQCLNRILHSSAFGASTRAKQFLAFVVERKLEGRQDEIKERTIGTEVFARTVDFETSGDSIVRVNANEVRRRLAQYYGETPEPDPVQIVLPPGTYVPEFHLQGDVQAPGRVMLTAQPMLPVRGQISRKAWWGCGLAAAAITALLAYSFSSRPSPFDRFWSPVLNVSAAPVLSLPATDTFQLTPEAIQTLHQVRPGEFLKLAPDDVQSFHNWHSSLPVLQAAISISSVLQRKGKSPLIRIGADLKMDEVRGHPVIAIGSFSNPWTRQNVAGLRFTFDRGASDKESPSIRDSRNPERSWSLPSIYPKPQDRDYAIVSRTFDPVTGEPFVSLAGLHSFGCQIAGEFVTQPSFWNDVAARAPSGWETMNLQIVLETSVVGITTSTPKIADTHFWK